MRIPIVYEITCRRYSAPPVDACIIIIYYIIDACRRGSIGMYIEYYTSETLFTHPVAACGGYYAFVTRYVVVVVVVRLSKIFL